jgi:MFS family permease
VQVTFIISAYAFISPLSSSMIAPALDQIGGDLRIPSGLKSLMVLSIFVLAYAFGPFVLSPSSEIWGRISVIRYGNLVFIFKLACGSVRTKDELIAFRFRAGLGSSATLGAHSACVLHLTNHTDISPIWALEYFQTTGIRKRGRGMSVYQLAPVLGPAISPISEPRSS